MATPPVGPLQNTRTLPFSRKQFAAGAIKGIQSHGAHSAKTDEMGKVEAFGGKLIRHITRMSTCVYENKMSSVYSLYNCKADITSIKMKNQSP